MKPLWKTPSVVMSFIIAGLGALLQSTLVAPSSKAFALVALVQTICGIASGLFFAKVSRVQSGTDAEAVADIEDNPTQKGSIDFRLLCGFGIASAILFSLFAMSCTPAQVAAWKDFGQKAGMHCGPGAAEAALDFYQAGGLSNNDAEASLVLKYGAPVVACVAELLIMDAPNLVNAKADPKAARALDLAHFVHAKNAAMHPATLPNHLKAETHASLSPFLDMGL